MKRKISLLIMVLVCLALVAGILAACNPTGKKVTFYDNFENGSVYHVSIAEGDAERTMPKDPQKAGYTFAGWYFYNGENSFGRDSYKKFDIGDYDGKEDLSVFARWISAKPEEQQFVVSFYTADGVFLESDIVARGSALEIPNSLYEQEITGSGSKTFVGWKELSTGKAWFFGAGEAVLTDADLQPILVESLNATLTVEGNISVGAAVAAYDFGNAVKTSEEWLRFEIRDAVTNAIIADNASDEAVPLAYGDNKFEVQGFYETIDGERNYIGNPKEITVTRTRGEYIAVFNYIEADNGRIKEGTIDENGFIAKPGDDIDLTKEGYNFIGWQLRNGKTAKFWNFATDKVSADIFEEEEKNYGEVILYACYEPVPYYVAKFMVGKGETLIGEAEVSVSFDAPAILPTASKKGYTFTGWESESGEQLWVGEDLAVNGGVAVTTDNWDIECDGAGLIFYAEWEVITYSITYIVDNQSYSVDEKYAAYNIETGLAALPAAPEKEGYTFKGWYDNAAFKGEEVKNIPKGSTDNKVFYAKWTPEEYTITYNLDGGTNAEGNPTKYDVEDDEIKLSDPTKEGYKFLGWYDEDGNKVTGIHAGSTGDKTFWAKWTPEEYTITYNLGGGYNNAANPTSYNIESGKIILGDPYRPGYTFEGWKEGDATIETGNTGNKNFTAKWKVITYSITYIVDNKVDSVTKYTIETETESVDFPTAPEKEGYTFKGWYENGKLVEKIEITEDNIGNRIFYAEWEVRTYSITYIVDNQSYSVDEKYATYNIETGLDALPAAPEKEGYTFEGWYNNAAFEGDAVMVILAGSTGDKTFWAKWEEPVVEPEI